MAVMFYDRDILSLRHNGNLPGSQWPDKFCRIQCCAPGMVQHLLLATLSFILNTWKLGRSERLFQYLHIFKEGIAMCFGEYHSAVLLWPVCLLDFKGS